MPLDGVNMGEGTPFTSMEKKDDEVSFIIQSAHTRRKPKVRKISFYVLLTKLIKALDMSRCISILNCVGNIERWGESIFNRY